MLRADQVYVLFFTIKKVISRSVLIPEILRGCFFLNIRIDMWVGISFRALNIHSRELDSLYF